MKILRTNDFVSERVKVKPITNAEWGILQKKTFVSSVKPGDDLEDGEIVLIGHNKFKYYRDTFSIGTYNSKTKNIEYGHGNYPWENLKKSFMHHDYMAGNDDWMIVLRIWKQIGKVRIKVPDDFGYICNNLEKVMDFEDMLNANDYVCVYENIYRLRQFDIETSFMKQHVE